MIGLVCQRLDLLPRYILLLSPQGQFPFLGGPPAWAIDETTLRNVIETCLRCGTFSEDELPKQCSRSLPIGEVMVTLVSQTKVDGITLSPAQLELASSLAEDESLNFFYIWPGLDSIGS